MIHVCTSANENYAAGLLVMVASLLDSLDKKESLTLHLLNGGLSGKSLDILCRLCRTVHPHCALDVIHIDQSVFKGANLGPGNSYLTYARLLIGSFIKADKIIHIDSDMVVLRDVREIWNTSMTEGGINACQDLFLKTLHQDCPLPLTAPEQESPYINCGFIMIDLQFWRAHSLEAGALEMARNYKCDFWDQTVLNYLYRNRSLCLDDTWNWQSEFVVASGEQVWANYHYIREKKPWKYFGSTLKYKTWRFYYANYVGNVYALFLRKNSLLLFFSGLKEHLIRHSRLLKLSYFKYLKFKAKKGRAGHQSIIDYYNKLDLSASCQCESRLFKEFSLARIPAIRRVAAASEF
jgi:lipopolysaccharide biosynthesis glycosyltransferase